MIHSGEFVLYISMKRIGHATSRADWLQESLQLHHTLAAPRSKTYVQAMCLGTHLLHRESWLQGNTHCTFVTTQGLLTICWWDAWRAKYLWQINISLLSSNNMSNNYVICLQDVDVLFHIDSDTGEIPAAINRHANDLVQHQQYYLFSRMSWLAWDARMSRFFLPQRFCFICKYAIAGVSDFNMVHSVDERPHQTLWGGQQNARFDCPGTRAGIDW